MKSFKLAEMLNAVKAKPIGSNQYQGHCPCHDDSTPSLSITEKTDGTVLFHCHTGCSQSQLTEAFSQYWQTERHVGRGRPTNRERAVNLWNDALPLIANMDTPLASYWKMRGLLIPQNWPASLRFHPEVYNRESPDSEVSYHPALVAKITNAAGEQIGLHRTYLSNTGLKATIAKPKKMLGDSKGGFVMLGDSNDTKWGVSEGIETGLAVRQALSMTIAATLSANNLEAIELPNHVNEIHIFADFDQSLVGQNAANQLAMTYLNRGLKVFLHLPEPSIFDLPGSKADWLDILVHSGEDAIRNAISKSVPFVPPEERSEAVCVGSVETQEVNWLVYPYFPRGFISSLEGDPGLGKSHVALSIAAALSCGEALLCQESSLQGSTLFFTMEDDISNTIRPRLERLGADLNFIHVYDKFLKFDADGLSILEREVRIRKPLVVFFDPIMAYMGANTDTNKANEVRAILSQVSLIAKKYQIAVVGIRHLSKGSDKSNLIYRASGSIDFTAIARSALMIERHPDNPYERVVLHIKSNLARYGSSLGFTFEDDHFKWLGVSSITADTLMGKQGSSGKPDRQIDKAADFLKNVLQNGAIFQAKIMELSRQHGLSESSLFRAKPIVGVKSTRVGGGWEWSL